MAFKLNITRITPLYPKQVYLEFGFENLKELRVPTPTLTITLETSEAPEGPFTQIATTTSFYVIVDHEHMLSFYRTIYYRARITYGSQTIYSDVKTIQNDLLKHEYLRRRKMLYDEQLMLQKYSGIEIAVLKRRHVGTRCTTCWDPNTKSVTVSHCPTCKGTGFLNPYYDPFYTLAQRPPEKKQVQEATPESANEVDQTTLYLLDYPIISPQDVIVEIKPNERYKVMAVDLTQIRRYIVHQELTLSKLDHSSVEYNIPI